MIFKLYISSVFLTILWSFGINSINTFVYLINLFPLLGLLIWFKKIKYTSEVLVLLILLILNMFLFNSGFKFGIKLVAYISAFILSYSLDLKIPRRKLKILLILCLLTFFVNQIIGFASSNFFFQRNSFPAFLFGITALVTFDNPQNNNNNILIAVIVLATIFSGTIGATLALLVSFLFTLKISYLPIKLLLTSIVLYFFHSFIFEISIISRLLNMYTYIFSKVSITDIILDSSLTYATFATEQFTDLSAVFRLFHWRDILIYHFEDNLFKIFFGQGLDSVKFVLPLSMHKYPHNDIIRVFVECGLVFGYLFYRNILLFMRHLSGHTLLFIRALVFFLFTENLLNNFVSTLPIFLLMGMVLRKVKK